MKFFLLPVFLLAACGPDATTKPRPNRAILAFTLANPKAECYSNAIALEGTDAPDTAYCRVSADGKEFVQWCEAYTSRPPKCTQIGARELPSKQAELPPPDKIGGVK